jgi:hypothetical protein
MAPDTGGSGGGGPNKATWTPFEPQALLGLNSTVVFGSNLQVACPLNFQLAMGSNLQVCIHPNAWQTLYGEGQSTMPPEVNQVLGSGLGGNMQLTMGTSANFVMGQIFDINLGPRRITIDVHNKTGIQSTVQILGTAIMVATTAFLIGYAAAADDDARSALAVGFEALMQALIMGLMDVQGLYHNMDEGYRKTFEDTFATGDQKTSFASTFTGNDTLGGALIATGIVGVFALPILLQIIGESSLHSEPATETYDVVDNSGQPIGKVTI